MSQKTLRNLKESPEPAFLWDEARGRIVWANPAGIALFDAQSLFDLIDRPFDPAEPGLATIRKVAETLAPDQVAKVELAFPSVGIDAPLTCGLTLHTLADSRRGILMVHNIQAPTETRESSSGLEAAIKLLPTPVVVFSQAGEVIYSNDAVLQLFAESSTLSAETLLDLRQLVAAFARLENSAVVSQSGKITGRFGVRDAVVTLRRLDDVGKAYAVATIDDVTERRVIEARMAQFLDEEALHPPVPNIDQTAAFERVGQSIRDEMAGQKLEQPGATNKLSEDDNAEVKAVTTTKALNGGRQQTIPETIKQAMERSGEAVIIVQRNTPVFATEKAATFLEFNSVTDLLASESLAATLSTLNGGRASCEFTSGMGRTLFGDVVGSSIPWLHGPARQFRIKPGKPAKLRALPVAEVAGRKPPDQVSESTGPNAASPVIAADTTRASANVVTTNAASEEIQAILDVVNDGIITLDDKARILSFSAGAESIFGQTISDVIGMPFVSLLADESTAVFENYLAALQQPGLASVFNDGREVLAKVKDAGITPLFLTLGRLQLQNADAVFCAVVRDITQFKHSESELRTAKDAAERVSQQKSDFLARIGHELRTPINAILGFSDLMRRDNGNALRHEKYLGYAHDIHASAAHLLSLINDLLDLSKVESGRMDLNFAAVSISDVVDYAIRMLEREAADHRVIVRSSIAENLPRVVADLRAMRQILINMISNAVKYTDAGGEVIVSATTSKAGQLKLRIRDTGVGMSADQLQQALEPFKRVATEGREAQGTGLGLPLTKALAEANRASFDIQSEPGQGTTVEIVFPTTRVLAE